MPGDVPEPLERSILEAQRLATVGGVAAKVVHFLNNPLTLLRVHIAFVAERLEAGEATGTLAEEAPTLARELRDSLRSIEHLVTALSRYVRADEPPEDVDLVECVEAAYQVAGLTIGYGTRLELARPESPLVVHAVQGHVLQVLTAVFLHAGSLPAEYGALEVSFRGPEGGVVTVVLRDARPAGVRSIAADGAGSEGFDPELGLALAGHIAWGLGGRVLEESDEGGAPLYLIELPVGR
jgi:C4-dicarboxylate-specific signal transduction histidine kinase